jgi:hypothetical protein
MTLIDISLKITYCYINKNNIREMELHLYSFIDKKFDHEKEIIYENNEYTKEIYKKLYKNVIDENVGNLFNLIRIKRI